MYDSQRKEMAVHRSVVRALGGIPPAGTEATHRRPLEPLARRLVYAGILLGLAGPVAAYTNPAAAVIGTSPAQVEANSPNIIANNLAKWPGSRLPILSSKDLISIYAYSPAARAVIQRLSPTTYNTMIYAVNAAVTSGNLISSGGTWHVHYVVRSGEQQPTQQQIDVVTETYLDFLTASPFPPLYQTTDEEEFRAMVETLTLLSETLDAAHTGWLLGYENAGPLARWAIETFTPSIYDGIGSTIDSAVKALSEYAEALGAIAIDEAELTSSFNLPSYDFSGGGDYGVMDAMDFGVCDPLNGC